MMNVPFLDLKLHHAPVRAAIAARMDEVIERNAFAGGPFVAEFEEAFAHYCGAPHAIGVGSGTEALWIALLALDIGAGHEVITVPNTFIATAEAISFTGARPVFVDVDPVTYNMNPDRLEAAITPSTRAIIPVHLFGQPAEMDPILAIADRHGIPVIEDAAQAHGAAYCGRPTGSMGAAGCFSFYPGKNLGAWGEAGAITTANDQWAEKMRILRDHGQPAKYVHSRVGWNARMDGLQAVVLKTKLDHLDEANAARRGHARRYTEQLQGVPGIHCPREAASVRHVYHIYAIRTQERDALKAYLQEKGVATGIHYPYPLHLQGAYAPLCYREGDFPVAETCAAQFLSLPMFPELTDEQIDYVCEQIITAVTIENQLMARG